MITKISFKGIDKEFPIKMAVSGEPAKITSVDDMIKVLERSTISILFNYKEIDFDEIMRIYLDDYALSEFMISGYNDDGSKYDDYIYTNYMIRVSLNTRPDGDDKENIVVEMTLAQLTEVDYSLRKMASIVAKDHNWLSVPEYKEALIEQSKILLDKYFAEHPLVSDCHGGVAKKYNATKDKRNLWVSNMFSYSLKEAAGLEPVLRWNATGEECEPWEYSEAVQFTIEMETYIEPLIAHQQKLEVQIRNCQTKAELDAIVIDYSNVN